MRILLNHRSLTIQLKRIIYSERKDADGKMYNLYLKNKIKMDFRLLMRKKECLKNLTKFSFNVYDGETITGGPSSITNFSFSKSDFPLNNFKTNSTLI